MMLCTGQMKANPEDFLRPLFILPDNLEEEELLRQLELRKRRRQRKHWKQRKRPFSTNEQSSQPPDTNNKHFRNIGTKVSISITSASLS